MVVGDWLHVIEFLLDENKLLKGRQRAIIHNSLFFP